MREAKFRAWNAEYKVMSESFTLEDLLHFRHEGADFRGSVVMQYTGLKDKNGVEIYEGDIVKVEFESKVWKVSFDFYGVGLEDKYGDYIDEDYENNWIPESGQIEILGNIYENPELLQADSSE